MATIFFNFTFIITFFLALDLSLTKPNKAESQSASYSFTTSFDTEKNKINNVNRILLEVLEENDEFGLGNTQFIENMTLYASVITSLSNRHSRRKKHNQHNLRHGHGHNSNSNSNSNADANGTSTNTEITSRESLLKELHAIIPAPLIEWTAVFTRPCPTFTHGHATGK
jgi:hypothetical protein